MYQQIDDYDFHHWAWYMGHTSMSQFYTGLSRFLTAAGYCTKWWCINKLIIIFTIELGIWVIRACPNFIRGCHVFWQLLVTVENDDVSTNWLWFSSLSLITFFDSCRLPYKIYILKRCDLYVSRIMWILCSTQPVNGHQRLHSPFLWPDIWVKSESNCICLRQIWVKIPKSAYSLTEGIGLSSPFLLLLANYSDIWQMSVI